MKILVCEDDPSVNGMLKLALRNHDLSFAGTFEEALKLCEKPWDCALIDVGLPDGSGLDLCRLLRLASEKPILIISGATGEQNQILGYEALADDYLEKPFSLPVLKAKIDSIARRNSSSLACDLENLHLMEDGLLKSEGVSVQLNLTTSVILHLLMRSSSPVSMDRLRAELEKRTGKVMSDSTLVVRISEIKRILHPFGWTVKNIRHHGYLLEKKG